MRNGLRDLVATVLVIAVAVPYVGYLLRGSMPFIQDPRGMAATGLVLGALAAVAVGRRVFGRHGAGRAAAVSAVGSLGVGIAALLWAESGTVSDVLLAVFMGTIGLTWMLAMMGDTVPLPGSGPGPLAHR